MNKQDFINALQPYKGRELTDEEEARIQAIAIEAIDSGAITPEQGDAIIAEYTGYLYSTSLRTYLECAKQGWTCE